MACEAGFGRDGAVDDLRDAKPVVENRVRAVPCAFTCWLP
jgi:hypothetical protein